MSATDAEQEIARELRLRVAPRPVTRLSRKSLIVLGTVASVAVAGAVAWAMTDRPHAKGQGELYQTGNQPPPDGIAALPADYASAAAPRLGPPLPGDLGRPMLNAGQVGSSPFGAASAAPANGASRGGAAQQVAQERDAARTSRLFSGDSAAQAPATSDPPPVDASTATATPPAAGLAGQPGDVAFLSGEVERRITSAERVQPPASRFVIQAGSIIPAALITGLRSDLPGQITAQVTQNVYDSPTGRYLLIPQGSRLVGAYDSQVSFGQSRVLLAWTRLILPGGRSIILEKEPGADAEGFAGAQDGVDHHWKQLFGAALLSTILGVGAEAGASQSDSEILQALRQGAANSMNQVGQQIVGRALDVQPTLTIRQGFPLRVMVTRDLVLEPIGVGER